MFIIDYGGCFGRNKSEAIFSLPLGSSDGGEETEELVLFSCHFFCIIFFFNTIKIMRGKWQPVNSSLLCSLNYFDHPEVTMRKWFNFSLCFLGHVERNMWSCKEKHQGTWCWGALCTGFGESICPAQILPSTRLRPGTQYFILLAGFIAQHYY